VEEHGNILDAYRTGRGAFRVRARWEKEEGNRGTWVSVITEIPYQVQKSRLIEKIAALLLAKTLPLRDDGRDAAAADIRIVLEPKHRPRDPELLMD
ncbi:DNA gyrase subunit A, partial [Bacillus safensis]|nr:DNA gyrase subunit A [Bacillus safensis]